MGELFALLSAIVWAAAVILFRRGGEHIEPLPFNLFKNVLALGLFAATLAVLGQPWAPAAASGGDWALLLASGALGIGVGDTLFLASLNRLGAGRQAIIDCTYSPLVTGCALLYLDEPVGAGLAMGIALVAGAVLVGTWEPRGALASDGASVAALTVPVAVPLAGLALGLGSMLAMAVGVVMVKPVLHRFDIVWVVVVRLVGGLALLAIPCARRSLRPGVARAFRPGPLWRITVPATLLGAYLGMLFWLLGMQLTFVNRASVLNQTSTVFILLFAAIFLGERLTLRKACAIGLGFLGALLAMA